MGSSSRKGSKILGVVSPSEAENFLCGLANLLDDSASVAKLLAKYPRMFHESTKQPAVFAYRRELRRAWKFSQDRRAFDWYLFALRRGHAMVERSLGFTVLKETLETPPSQRTDKDFDLMLAPPPSVTPFEAALFYFQTRVGDLAKYCPNPDCVAPYFIASKRSQKFCSEICAGSGTRESKRKWWRENRAKTV